MAGERIYSLNACTPILARARQTFINIYQTYLKWTASEYHSSYQKAGCVKICHNEMDHIMKTEVSFRENGLIATLSPELQYGGHVAFETCNNPVIHTPVILFEL